MAKNSKQASSDKAEAPKCPVTKAQFLSKAPGLLAVTVNGQALTAERKEFSTGSFGWYTNSKVMVEIDGKLCKVQANISLVVVGSKEVE